MRLLRFLCLISPFIIGKELNTAMIRSETVDCIDKDKITLLCDEAIKLGATITKVDFYKKYYSRTLGPIEVPIWMLEIWEI